MKQVLKAECRKTDKGLQVDCGARGFKLTLDEPEEMGSLNSGMNPLEAMLCALGGCQAVVATAFADAFGFKFEEFHLEIEGDWDPDGFMGAADVRNGLTEIRVTPHFKTSETVERCNEFAEFIESKCPVADCLINGVNIVKNCAVVEK